MERRKKECNGFAGSCLGLSENIRSEVGHVVESLLLHRRHGSECRGQYCARSSIVIVDRLTRIPSPRDLSRDHHEDGPSCCCSSFWARYQPFLRNVQESVQKKVVVYYERSRQRKSPRPLATGDANVQGSCLEGSRFVSARAFPTDRSSARRASFENIEVLENSKNTNLGVDDISTVCKIMRDEHAPWRAC